MKKITQAQANGQALAKMYTELLSENRELEASLQAARSLIIDHHSLIGGGTLCPVCTAPAGDVTLNQVAAAPQGVPAPQPVPRPLYEAVKTLLDYLDAGDGLRSYGGLASKCRAALLAADAAPAPAAGPGVRMALENLLAWDGNNRESSTPDFESLSDLFDAAQLALDQEPDGAELVRVVKRAQGILNPNVPWTKEETRRSWKAWENEVIAALAAWKGGAK